MTTAAAAAAEGRGRGALGPLRVVVVEDHQSVAQALVMVLRDEGMEAFAVTGSALGRAADHAAALHPDVVLLDLDLGPEGGRGTPLIGPLTAAGASVLMLSGVRERRELAECVEAGAAGVLDKAAPVESVLAAVQAAAGGGDVMSDAERFDWLAGLRSIRAEERDRLRPFELLTPREQDVLVRLGEGLSAAEIAELQFVSVFTVRGHIRSILTKLGVGSQLAAVAMARRAGWL